MKPNNVGGAGIRAPRRGRGPSARARRASRGPSASDEPGSAEAGSPGIEESEGDEIVDDRKPKIVDKPWGREVWYAHTDRYAGKVLEVEEGHRLSLQKHRVKHETLFLQSGRMRFTLDDEVFEWEPGQLVEVPPGTVHRMEALEDSVILEVSTPELDDVVRLEDEYGRS